MCYLGEIGPGNREGVSNLGKRWISQVIIVVTVRQLGSAVGTVKGDGCIYVKTELCCSPDGVG